jgi:hypothetical protein
MAKRKPQERNPLTLALLGGTTRIATTRGMPDPETTDHDQRLKVLLKEFFEQFLRCYFPDWARRFDFTELTWLDKEVFLAPPQGEKRQLDLVGRLRLRPQEPPPEAGPAEA